LSIQAPATVPVSSGRVTARDVSPERKGATVTHWLRSILLALAWVAFPGVVVAGDMKVVFISPTGPPEFWNLVTTTMKAAAAELGIDVDVFDTRRSREQAIAITKEVLGAARRPDYIIATNDVGAGGEIIELADAAQVKLILLNNDIDPKEWPTYGLPRQKHRNWLGSIVPDHEGAGYGIGAAILSEAARLKRNRPLRVLALTGEATTPAAVERVRGLKRATGVMSSLLGANSIDLMDVLYLDWTAKTAESAVRELTADGRKVDVLWAANDPMALGAMAALSARGQRPGGDVLVGGLNWSQPAIDKVLSGEMVLTHGGHFLLGASAMIMLRDYQDGRDFIEEDLRLQVPMTAMDRALARRFPEIGRIDWSKVDFARFSKTRNPNLARYEFAPDAMLAQLGPMR
jgi:ABC-type sugar transport system substrate-binding protein